jgi:hypothetical protein
MAITLKTRKAERKAKPQAKQRAIVTQKVNIPIIPGAWGKGGGRGTNKRYFCYLN